MSKLDRAERSDGQVSIAIPSEITRRAHRATTITQVAALLSAPYMVLVLLNEPPRPAYTNLFDSYQERVTLAMYLVPMMMAYVGFVYLIKMIGLRSIAFPISTLVGAAYYDEELRIALRKRLGKSYFVYGKKGVPRPMRRVRISTKPNGDGTFWMMTIDEQFTTLHFQKYRTGEIREPNDPDLPSVKYLPGSNPWVDFK